jgi:hypothetical protein
MVQRLLAVLPFVLVSATAAAKDVKIRTGCNAATCQDAFESISEDIIAAVDYKAYGPAEATGISGVGVGVVMTYVPVDVKGDWQNVTGEEFSGLGIVGLQVTKGLPLNVDVGAFYTTIPETGVDVYGGELRYAILAGSTTSPALAVRGSWVTISGIEDFDVDSQSAELALSKGFGPITPYVGVGYVWGVCEPDPSTGLYEKKVRDTKASIGVRLSLGLFEFTPQVGQVGDNVTYGARLGFSI